MVPGVQAGPGQVKVLETIGSLQGALTQALEPYWEEPTRLRSLTCFAWWTGPSIRCDVKTLDRYYNAPKKRRVFLRPEARSASGRQPRTRPTSAGSTQLRSCSPGLAGPCEDRDGDPLEVPLALQVSHLLQGARSQGVHTDYTVPFREQSLAEVTAEEVRPPLTSARLFLATPEAPVAYPGGPDLPRVQGVAAVHEDLGLLHEG